MGIQRPPWTIARLGASAALGVIACQPSPPANLLTAEVQRVVSGQTIEVTIPSEQPAQIQTVRLLGLEAPDPRQAPWGPEAAATLAETLPPRSRIGLEFDTEPLDAYQRRLAYVWRDETLVNEYLIAQGQALAATREPNTRYSQRFEQAQDYARLLGHGLWHPDRPLRQTPAEFRAGATQNFRHDADADDSDS